MGIVKVLITGLRNSIVRRKDPTEIGSYNFIVSCTGFTSPKMDAHALLMDELKYELAMRGLSVPAISTERRKALRVCFREIKQDKSFTEYQLELE